MAGEQSDVPPEGRKPRDDLWGSIESTVIARIKAHPFIQGIIDGSLKEDTFR
jgi:thiaminase